MAGIFIDALPPVVTPAMSDVFAIDQASTTYQVSNTQILSLYQTNASGTWGIDISGNAATATTSVTSTTATNANNLLVTQVSTNASFFPLFVSSSTTGNKAVDLGAGLTFNPSTNILTTTTFVGALTGNASTATLATNATNTAITDDTATNATMYPTWVTAATGNLPQKVSSTKLTFNPSTGVLVPVSIAPSAQASVLNMNSHQINNVTDGVAAQDAVTVSQLAAIASPLTTKGDIYTFTTVSARLAVGTTNGQVLQVASGAATGLAYSTATYPATATNAARILRANGANWVETTSTFADTYAASGFLYANGANNVAGLATANNGVPVTSNTGVPSILAGPGTTGNLFISNAAAAPSFTTFTYPTTVGATGSIHISNGTNIVSSTSLWPNTVGSAGKIVRSDGTVNAYTTSTYPDTNAVNTLLYASSANVMAALATANSGVLVTDSGGVPSISSTLPSFTTNTITFSPTTAGIKGTTTNDSTAAGNVGEYAETILLIGSEVTLTSLVAANVTSVSLTAGDWDVWGEVWFDAASTTTPSSFWGSINTASATFPTVPATGTAVVCSSFAALAPVSSGAQNIVSIAPCRALLSGTTTYYLNAKSGFGTSTMKAYGKICARRRR